MGRSRAGALALVAAVLGMLVVAGCGGGSGSSRGSTGSGSGSSTASTNSPDSAWIKEMRSVMSGFENGPARSVIESINTTYSQRLLEPLYAAYSIDFMVLAKQLRKTHPIGACVAARKRLLDGVQGLTAASRSLADGGSRDETEYGALTRKEGVKLARFGKELTRLSAAAHC